MKRTTAIALCLAVMLGLLTACGGAEKNTDASRDRPLRIVTTIFPIYDWVREILGDNAGDAELALLLDSGVDLHSYQPSVDDIVRISDCDLFIYVGGESDAWIEDALRQSADPDMVVIALLDALGSAAKEEELVEGMESEPEDGGSTEYDEHVWLSLRTARTLCGVIAGALARLDPANADAYAANAAQYDTRLDALDRAYAAAAEGAPFHTVLFGDRFPFRYLIDDYDLDYYAAFAGCSAETEASFETIIFLAGKLDELELPAILHIESDDGSIARTIRDNTRSKDQAILTLDSLQSTTAGDVSGGVTYLSIMEDNLAVLRAALGG